MRSIYATSIALIINSASAFAADTGNFSITNNNFRDLFNANNRTGVVKPTPWAGSFWAFGSNGIADKENRSQSPSQKYDKWARLGNKATAWENESHSCKNVDKELLQGCKDWWGHCNAWSAAAVTHAEPRDPITVDGIEFGVADQKAYLTELWMASGSLFAGDTNKAVETGDWVCDPDSKTAKETDDSGTSNYEKFWDLTPRDFFLIMTNYVGQRSTGVVIDRFTGDQVWNQPIVGYRFEPITEVGVDPDTRQNYARITMKIYWAHDGVEGDFKSAVPFDIEQIDSWIGSKPGYGTSYESRELVFKLFFSAPVEVRDGNIVKAGRIVGEGLWDHQENCASVAELDQGHPDFVWRPTELSSYGEANPYIKADKVFRLLEKQGSGGGSVNPGGNASNAFKVQFSLDYLARRNDLAVKRYIRKMFRRSDVTMLIGDDMTRNGRRVFVTLTFPDGVTVNDITNILTESGASAIDVKPVG